MEMHLQVPIAFMGGLIGMGGETLKRLELETGCKFRIAPKEKAFLRLVVLSGNTIGDALVVMFNLFADEICKADQGALSTKDIGSTFIFKINVGSNQVGAIIGKAGKGAEALRADHNCSVKIKGHGEVELEGSIKCIQGATLSIWEMIQTVMPSRMPSLSNTQYAGPEIEVDILFSDEIIGMIIGKRGETISGIRKECRGVHIEIQGEKFADGRRYIKLKGTCSATARAHQLLAFYIESDERRKKRKEQRKLLNPP